MLLFIFSFVLASCSPGAASSATPTPVPALVSQDKIIFTVKRGPITSQREYYGEVVPSQQEELFFRASGYVSRVTVKDGDYVKKGDVMAEEQIDDLLDQLQQAQIDLQIAQDNADNAALQRQYDLQKAQSDVTILQKQVELAQKQVDSSYGSQKEDAQTQLEIKQEQLKTAQAWLNLVQGRKDTSSQGVVQNKQLAVARLERLISDRQVLAPCDCIVLKRLVAAGNNIDAFNTAFLVGDPAVLVTRIAYNLELSGILEPSTEVYLSTTKSKEKLYPVKYIPDFLPVTNKKSGLDTSGDQPQLTYFYFTTPDELPRDQLPLGGGVTLVVVLGKKDDALLLPPVAIRGNENFNYVIVLEDDYHRRVEVIKIGLKSDKEWEVIADLKEGDQILGP